MIFRITADLQFKKNTHHRSQSGFETEPIHTQTHIIYLYT